MNTPDEIIAQKKQLRKEMHRQRAALNPQVKNAYDAAICKSLQEIIKACGYQKIHAYIPIGSEIDITPLLQFLLAEKRSVFVPKTLPKRELQNLPLTSFNDLEEGPMGTRHPKSSSVYTGTYDLIILPGLAFDAQRYRLGYGGGYYDAFLAQHTRARNIAIAYPFQQVEEVPRESHDRQVQEVMYGV